MNLKKNYIKLNCIQYKKRKDNKIKVKKKNKKVYKETQTNQIMIYKK